MSKSTFNSKKFAELFANDLLKTLNEKYPANWVSSASKVGAKWICSVDLILGDGSVVLRASPLDRLNYAADITFDNYSHSVEGEDPCLLIPAIIFRLSNDLRNMRSVAAEQATVTSMSQAMAQLINVFSLAELSSEDIPAKSEKAGDPCVTIVSRAHVTGVIQRIGQMVRDGNTVFLYTIEARYGSKFRFEAGGLYYVAIDSNLLRSDPVPSLGMAQVGDLLQFDFDGEIHSMVNILPKKLHIYGIKGGPW